MIFFHSQKRENKLPLIITGGIVSLTVMTSGCNNEPGKGGTSTITGKIIKKKYDPATNTFSIETPAKEWDVYIIYDSDVSYNDREKTDYEGDFAFRELRKGKYKIYTFSIDTIAYKGPPFNPKAEKIAIIKEIEITKNRQVVDAGVIYVADD